MAPSDLPLRNLDKKSLNQTRLMMMQTGPEANATIASLALRSLTTLPQNVSFQLAFFLRIESIKFLETINAALVEAWETFAEAPVDAVKFIYMDSTKTSSIMNRILTEVLVEIYKTPTKTSEDIVKEKTLTPPPIGH